MTCGLFGNSKQMVKPCSNKSYFMSHPLVVNFQFHCFRICLLPAAWCCFLCHCMSSGHAGDKLPPDERAVVDPELAELQREWLQAREHHLGHLSSFSFDLSSAPPGVPRQKKTAGGSSNPCNDEALPDIPALRHTQLWFEVVDTASRGV